MAGCKRFVNVVLYQPQFTTNIPSNSGPTFLQPSIPLTAPTNASPVSKLWAMPSNPTF